MTIEERAEQGAQLKKSGACNCCQAVAAVLADQAGLSQEALMQIASGFGVGMGNMEATCGALVGANMILGLRTDGMGTVKQSRELLAKFKEKCGAVTCKDLKGVATGKVLCECDDCVRNAVCSLGEILGE